MLSNTTYDAHPKLLQKAIWYSWPGAETSALISSFSTSHNGSRMTSFKDNIRAFFKLEKCPFIIRSLLKKKLGKKISSCIPGHLFGSNSKFLWVKSCNIYCIVFFGVPQASLKDGLKQRYRVKLINNVFHFGLWGSFYIFWKNVTWQHFTHTCRKGMKFTLRVTNFKSLLWSLSKSMSLWV